MNNKEYFSINPEDLKDKTVFSFNLHIFNPHNEKYHLFLHSSSPLDDAKIDLLNFIIEKNGELLVSKKQKKTFLRFFGYNENDIESLAKKVKHPDEEEWEKYVDLLDKHDDFNDKQAFNHLFESENFTPLLERVRLEIMAISPSISPTVSLARKLVKHHAKKITLTNKILVLAYFICKVSKITDPESLGALTCAVYFHHLGYTQLNNRILHRKQMELSDDQRRDFEKHPGLSLHLIDKMGLPLDRKVISIIEEHHERFDGSGFPHKKQGGSIEPLALILGAASHIIEMYEKRIVDQDDKLKSIINFITKDISSAGLEKSFGDTILNSLEYLTINLTQEN